MIINNKLLIGVLIVATIIIGWLIYFAYSQAGQCLQNPYVYGARTMKNVECSCSQVITDKLCPALFDFNDTTFHIKVNKCGTAQNNYPNLTLGS